MEIYTDQEEWRGHYIPIQNVPEENYQLSLFTVFHKLMKGTIPTLSAAVNSLSSQNQLIWH